MNFQKFLCLKKKKSFGLILKALFYNISFSTFPVLHVIGATYPRSVHVKWDLDWIMSIEGYCKSVTLTTRPHISSLYLYLKQKDYTCVFPYFTDHWSFISGDDVINRNTKNFIHNVCLTKQKLGKCLFH